MSPTARDPAGVGRAGTLVAPRLPGGAAFGRGQMPRHSSRADLLHVGPDLHCARLRARSPAVVDLVAARTGSRAGETAAQLRPSAARLCRMGHRRH